MFSICVLTNDRNTGPSKCVTRSESKSGYDKSLRKGGGGAHNWGSVRDEYDLERDALEDNDFEDEELKPTETPNSSESTGNSAAPTEEEIAKAREFRAKALKDGNGERF